MVRDVSVSIILPESNGSIDPNQEDWDNEDPYYPGEDRRALVLSEIQAGLDWYIDKEPLADLTFTYHLQVIETSYEPISRQDNDTCWIEEIMGNLGYTEGYDDTRTRNYDNDLRQQDGTDWAFTIFVVDSLNDEDGMFSDGLLFAWAYLGGPYTVMTYDNDNYDITKMDVVINHETGHIFWALDEYKGSVTCNRPEDCERTSGFLEVENQNCELEACESDVPCIMRASVLAYRNGQICYYTRGQIGWRDEDGDGIIDAIDSDYNPWGDSDADGIVDYFDDCPNEYGPPQNHGCPSLTAPCIRLPETEHDFGDVLVGLSADWKFIIQNVGGDTLVIDDITCSDSVFTIPSPQLPTSVPPYDKTHVMARFTPIEITSYAGRLVISSNDPYSPTVQIRMQGVGTPTGLPRITVSETQHDFGNISLGAGSVWILKVSNIGKSTLVLDSIVSYNQHFMVSWPNFPQEILPDTCINVGIVFKPTEAMSYTGKLTIFSNDPDSQTVHVELRGTGIPSIIVSDTWHDFGNVVKGRCEYFDFWVAPYKSWKLVLVIDSIVLSDSAFTITSLIKVLFNPTTTLPASLPETLRGTFQFQDTLKATVEFMPTEAAAHICTLGIWSHASEVENPTQYILLEGTGILPISLSETQHDFGNIPLGAGSVWILKVSNIGKSTLVLDSIVSNNAHFIVSWPDFPQEILPDTCINVGIVFKPTETMSYTGKLTIFSNDPDSQTVHVELRGTGIPSISLSSTAHDFGDVATGSYADWPFYISNIGGVLSVDSISSDNPVFTTSAPGFPQNVAPYDNIRITVRFAPADKTSYTGKLTIFSNNPPQYISLKGTATSAMAQTLSNENVYAYPNPFNPENEEAKIRFVLAKSANVTIKIFDSRNDLVKTLIENLPAQSKAMQSISWDGKNEAGHIVSNGVYFFVITTDKGEKAIGKVAVLRK